MLRKAKKNKQVTNELKEIVETTGGFQYANKKIAEFSDKALLAINDFPDTIYKQKLIELVNYNGNRIK